LSKFDNRPTRHIDNEEGQGKNIFFNKADTSTNDENKVVTNVDYDEKIRQTYYVTELQRKALALMAATEDIDKSAIIRAALDAYIPQNYMRMVLMK
jgi:hypothetical protein